MNLPDDSPGLVKVRMDDILIEAEHILETGPDTGLWKITIHNTLDRTKGVTIQSGIILGWMILAMMEDSAVPPDEYAKLEAIYKAQPDLPRCIP